MHWSIEIFVDVSKYECFLCISGPPNRDNRFQNKMGIMLFPYFQLQPVTDPSSLSASSIFIPGFANELAGRPKK